MILKNTIAWNNEYKHDGLLYFAQRIVEMLYYETIDIYRAPLLNTSRLIDEYLLLSNGSAKPYHLDEVFNEFMNSLKSDIIIHYKWGEERINQIVEKLNKDQVGRKQIMEYLCHAIGKQYFEWTQEYVRFIVPQGKEKRKIERAIRCFVPELLHQGYSSDEIYHSAKRILFEDIEPENALDEFLKRYDQKKKRFIVYTAISNRLLIFREILEKRLNISFVDDGNFDKIDTWEKYSKLRTDTIQALDASTAANIAYKNIELFTCFYQFFGNYSGRLIQNRMIVISEEETEDRKITVDRGKFNAIEDDNPPKIGVLAEMSITNLIHGARCSLPQIEKITKLHNRAIANNGLENGFLNLWSILEVICVTNPDASKIEQVKKIVLPFLQRDYLPVMFSDIAENLKRVMDATQYEELLSKISIGTKDYEKVACIVLLPEYNETFDLCVDNLCLYPVLRTRMLNIHDDCLSKNDLYSLTERYTQRISWHLYRIYRARNSIIHSGKRPADLKDLGEHLHAYVDSVASEVVIKLSMSTLCHISNVIVDSELQQAKWDGYFSKNEPIDFDSIHLLFLSQEGSWDQ